MPLIPLLLQAAPFLANLILGDKTGDAVQKVADIAGQVLGVPGTDHDALASALTKMDGPTAAALQTKLTEFAHDETMARLDADKAERQQQHDEIMGRIADVANARAQTIALAQAGSPLAWGSAVISALVLVTFAIVLRMVLTKAIPDGQESLVYIMLGALTTMATGVVGYWVGSSSGSAMKTDLLSKAPPVPKH
jgi:hypothetical protein